MPERPAGPLAPHDDPGELGPVALELRLVVGMRRSEREVAPADDVDAVLDPPTQVRLRTVDAGVEQRDGDAAPVEARERDVEAVPAARLEVALAEQRRRDGRGEGRPHRVDALHFRQPLEDRDRARVERRGEPGEHALERVVGRDREPLHAELGQDELLGRPGLRSPAALVGVGGPPAGRGDAIGERRRAQDDDHPLADRDPRAWCAREARPGDPRWRRPPSRASSRPPAATSTTVSARATNASGQMWSGRGGVGIEAKVSRIRQRLDVAGRRGDHRRIVRAERERRRPGPGQRGAKLGVGRDAPDDPDAFDAQELGRGVRPLDERTDERALVARGEVGTAPLELPGLRASSPRRGARS